MTTETEGKTSTRERLVQAARNLFLTRGYEATGIAEILRESGANSGSLYYFFKTKEDLLLAVLDWYVANLHAQVVDPVFARMTEPIERVLGILGGYRVMLTTSDCRKGCPIGNLALEMSEKSEAVREKIALNFENWRTVIRQCLIEAGDRLPDDIDPDKLSSFILTVMEGAIMQARAHRRLEPFDASVAMLTDYIERLLRAKNVRGTGATGSLLPVPEADNTRAGKPPMAPNGEFPQVSHARFKRNRT